ncbi:MAG: TadG family pilus assembly protein, partial [Actinomycetota bacterium]
MRRRLLCEQRGAISILAGLSLVFLIFSAAMTVDIGSAAWKKRSLQKMVDVVSLDAVRALGDRRNPLIDHYVQALDIAQKSATRNSFDYTDTANGNSLSIELGLADSATKAFTPLTAAQYSSANAVRVTATNRSDHKFVPGNVALTTRAIAMVEQVASFSVGSRLARLDSSTSPILNSVLGGMLGSTFSLDAVSYNGLADGTVKIGDVWTNLGLGSSSQILNSEVQVEDLINATATALNNQGDPTSVAAATILGTFATQLTSTAHFKFGDML